MSEWKSLFLDEKCTTSEKYRRFENSPVGLIARYYFKISKYSPQPLGKYIETILTGKTPPKEIPKYYESSDIDWFKPSEIGCSKFLNSSQEKISEISFTEKKATLFDKDWLLMVCIGSDIGRVSILQNIASANQQITGIKFNKNVIPEYAYYYFLANRNLILADSFKSTLPIINQNKIRNIPFICPSIDEQNEVISYLNYCLKCLFEKKFVNKKGSNLPEKIYDISESFFSIYNFSINSVIENNKQEKYVSQLKQAILQEAIAGQLTAEWRTQSPMQKGNPDTDAIALLAKIKAEKQQAIADGKLKKEKPLAEIAIDEIPFSIPNNWVWCRLVEVAESFEYGSSTKSLDSGKVPVLRMGNLQNGLVDFKNLVYTNDDDEIKQYALSYGDLLFNRTNSRELVGKTSLFLCNEKMIYAGYLVRYKMLGTISFHYANYVMNSQFHRDWCYTVKIDAIGQSNINATKLRSFPFPLPPLAEQKAIAEKVDKLMNIIDQLEQQIKHRKQLAEALMQTVLREAFE